MREGKHQLYVERADALEHGVGLDECQTSQSAKGKACKARSRSSQRSKRAAAAGAADLKSASSPTSAGPGPPVLDCLLRGAP